MPDLPHVFAPSFDALVATRWNRREFLLAGTAASGLVGARQTHDTSRYSAIEPSRDDAVLVSRELDWQVLLTFGDPLWPGQRPAVPRDRGTNAWLDHDAAARQARSFGDNCDCIAFFPLGRSRHEGLLCVNHEYVVAELTFQGLAAADKEASRARRQWIADHPEAVPWMQSAHGISIVHVVRENRRWRHRAGGHFTRRVTAHTPCDIHGPARGSDLLRTPLDPEGKRVAGTFANCAGGKTPWGTFLTAEENVQDYFGGAQSWLQTTRDELTRQAHERWPLREASAYGWELHDSRFDVRQSPREPLRHGWIVEVDPRQPGQAPRKRTALGRFCHEAATTTIARDGRVAVYMGDDAKFEYVYKFLTRDRFDPRQTAGNGNLLDHGVLHVARFEADGSGRWLPMVLDDNGPLNAGSGFRNPGDIVIRARAAADLLGATPMDRPEDIETNPLTGRVYVACTRNSDRRLDLTSVDVNGRTVSAACNAPNPRPANDHGHIVEITEAGDDAGSTRFRWNLFLLAGNPRDPNNRLLTRVTDLVPGELRPGDLYFAGQAGREALSPLAGPDNLGFDSFGRMWVASDAEKFPLGNNGCFLVPTAGPDRGQLQQILSGPRGAEITGPEFTPDGTTLFLSIQHPGEGGTVEAPLSHWPDGGDSLPRASVIALQRRDGDRL